MALATIDAQIADLERAKDIIIGASKMVVANEPPKPRKPRGKNKAKPGLPDNPQGL